MCDIFKTFPFVLVTFSFPFNARLLLLREHNYEFCCQSVGRKVPVLLLSSLAFLCFTEEAARSRKKSESLEQSGA